MRPNPAYRAVEELRKKPNFEYKVQDLQNQEESPYFLIELPFENMPLTIAGKTYQPDKTAPHLSVYALYKKSETQGLSAFHFTWYGFVDKDDVRLSVVLHIYFDSAGRYLYCQLKDRESQGIIPGILLQEEKIIQKYGRKSIQDILNLLLSHISLCFTKANVQVDQYLNQLDDISQHINTQYAKYKQIAQLCITAIYEKDKWTFNCIDPRARLLADLVFALDKKILISQESNYNPGFYAPASATALGSQKKDNQKKKKRKPQSQVIYAQPQRLMPALVEKLAEIDDKIRKKEEGDAISAAESALRNVALLNEKFELLLQDDGTSSVENELMAVLQQINQHRQMIEQLFQEKALEGDLDSVECLTPFIVHLKLSLFVELLVRGHFDVCKYIIRHFPESIFYLNHVCLNFSSNSNQKITDRAKEAYSLLQIVLAFHDSPKFLEMLVQNGANPNFYGASSKNEDGVLYLSVVHQKEDFVQMLLENGADPNPETSIVCSNIEIVNEKHISDISQFRKFSRQLRLKQPSVSSNNNAILLHTAIDTRNEKIITLLLQYGAFVTRKDPEGFDVIGCETCSNVYLPDLKIVQLLKKYGADINTIQGKPGNESTALFFACQRNNLDLVKGLIALGANPNQLVSQAIGKQDIKGNIVDVSYIPVTPFHKAVIQGYQDIWVFLITQDEKPVTFANAGMVLAFLLVNRPISIDFATLNLEFEMQMMDAALSQFVSKFRENEAIGYGDNDVLSALTYASKQGKEAYRREGYYLATLYFYFTLIFSTSSSQRHTACYNIARCFEKRTMVDEAINFLTICVEHDPQSQIAQRAAKVLQKLSQPKMVRPTIVATATPRLLGPATPTPAPPVVISPEIASTQELTETTSRGKTKGTRKAFLKK